MVSSQINPNAASTTQLAAAIEVPRLVTVEEVIAAKAEAAGVDPALAKKIAFCESTMRQYDETGEVLRGLHNPEDVGLFQINESFHKEKSEELGYDIYSTEGNIDYAMWLIKNEGKRHWKWSQPCWGAVAQAE